MEFDDPIGGQNSQSLKIFEVQNANMHKYSQQNSAEKRTVRIKIFDVLYNDQVCNLVYMQDISQVMKENDIEMV